MKSVGSGFKVLLFTLCIFWVTPVRAELLTYSFNGTMTRVALLAPSDPSVNIDLWLPGLVEGMPITGSISFDTAASLGNLNNYAMGPPSLMLVTAGSHVFSSGPGYTMWVSNDLVDDQDPLLNGDLVTCWSDMPALLTPPASGLVYCDDLTMRLQDPAGAAMSDLSVPTGDLNRFPYRWVGFDGTVVGGPPGWVLANIGWEATIDSIQPIPEPSTSVLVALGLGSLLLSQGGKRINCECKKD